MRTIGILRPVAFMLFISFLALGILSPAVAGAAQKIAIVTIDQEISTQRTVKGIKKALERPDLAIVYQESMLTGRPESDNQLINELKKFDPALFITVGSYATSTISGTFPLKSIIFATVMNPLASGFVASMQQPGGHITGAALDVPPDIQFTYLKRVVPKATRLGVLFSSETENIVRQAEAVSKPLGLKIIPIKIESEKDIPWAIDSICKAADALWSVADNNIYTPQSTKHIILQTLRNRIPIISFSQALVQAGGLFTLDFDFKDIGRQAGEIAMRVLRGTAPGEIPVATPGVLYFNYNEKTAGLINIKIPDDLLAIAKEVTK